MYTHIICVVAQSYLTLCHCLDYSPSGSSVHGISQERILEWVAIFFSRGSPRLRDGTQISCIAGGFFTTESPEKSSQCILVANNFIQQQQSSRVFLLSLESKAILLQFMRTIGEWFSFCPSEFLTENDFPSALLSSWLRMPLGKDWPE